MKVKHNMQAAAALLDKLQWLTVTSTCECTRSKTPAVQMDGAICISICMHMSSCDFVIQLHAFRSHGREGNLTCPQEGETQGLYSSSLQMGHLRPRRHPSTSHTCTHNRALH